MELQEVLEQQSKPGFLEESLEKEITFAGKKAVNAFGALLVAPTGTEDPDLSVFIDGLADWPEGLSDNYIIAKGKLIKVDTGDISYYALQNASWDQV